MSLRTNHPNFWLVVVGDVIGLAWLGIAFTFIVNTSPTWRTIEDVAPLRTFGLIFLALATALVIGVIRAPMLFRYALGAAVGVLSLFAIGTSAAIVDDLTHKGSTPGAAAPGLFTFFAICLIAQAREPRTNPDAARR